MVRIINAKNVDQYVKYFEYAGLSTDTKPSNGGSVMDIVNGERATTTIGIATGSLFLEVDTGDVYSYNEASATWCKIAELGGGS